MNLIFSDGAMLYLFAEEYISKNRWGIQVHFRQNIFRRHLYMLLLWIPLLIIYQQIYVLLLILMEEVGLFAIHTGVMVRSHKLTINTILTVLI